MTGYDKWEYLGQTDSRFPDPSDMEDVVTTCKVVVNTALNRKPTRPEKDKFYAFIPRMNQLERSFSR